MASISVQVPKKKRQLLTSHSQNADTNAGCWSGHHCTAVSVKSTMWPPLLLMQCVGTATGLWLSGQNAKSLP